MTAISTTHPTEDAQDRWPLAPEHHVAVLRSPDAATDRAVAVGRGMMDIVARASALALPGSAIRVALELLTIDPAGTAAATLAAETLGDAFAECGRSGHAIGLVVLDLAASEMVPLLGTVSALLPKLPAIAILGASNGVAIDTSCYDRLLFDLGYVRLRPGASGLAADTASFYVRSALITDLGLLREPSEKAISMATLGMNGRFGNQLFQYAFLYLYGLRNNCRVQTPRWIGQMLYGITADPPDPSFIRQNFTVFTGVERHLWTMSEPPTSVDFFGYFQEVPASWRHHRNLLRQLFTPRPDFLELIERWFRRSIEPGSTLVGIHVRRGDYSQFSPEHTPWFRTIPVEWYKTLLDEIWPTLERPVLFIATDDADTVVPHFAEYAPLMAPASELVIPELQFIPDFTCLQRSSRLTVVNSSFSRMASLLAEEGQTAYLPNVVAQRFERYEPWLDEDFWMRFEA